MKFVTNAAPKIKKGFNTKITTLKYDPNQIIEIIFTDRDSGDVVQVLDASALEQWQIKKAFANFHPDKHSRFPSNRFLNCEVNVRYEK